MSGADDLIGDWLPPGFITWGSARFPTELN
jgi:hypothetical protein